MERNLTYRYYYYFLTHASNPPRVRVFLHDKSYLGRSAIHGKTRGKTRENPQTRPTGAGLVRVRFWLPRPVPHVPYPQPTAGISTRDIP